MDLFLTYINKIGKNWKDEFIYEFIFSDSIKNIDGEEWDSYPASGNPAPPHKKFIKKVGVISSTIELFLIQNSDTFSIWDAVDGIIAIAWENIDGYEEYPERRLFFSFGEPIKSVSDKLYELDLVLEFEDNKKVNKTTYHEE